MPNTLSEHQRAAIIQRGIDALNQPPVTKYGVMWKIGNEWAAPDDVCGHDSLDDAIEEAVNSYSYDGIALHGTQVREMLCIISINFKTGRINTVLDRNQLIDAIEAVQ